VQRADGWREEVKARRSPGADGATARTRKVYDQDGVIQEVWHEVLDFAGRLIHQDRKPINREDPAA
jgi:hypothetical protein